MHSELRHDMMAGMSMWLKAASNLSAVQRCWEGGMARQLLGWERRRYTVYPLAMVGTDASGGFRIDTAFGM